METTRIAELLQPYLLASLGADELEAVRAYLDLLVRWNAKTNLTAVRDPEEMVRRHFGESFFAAACLIAQESPQTAIDLGSGAGFPGVPLAIYAPQVAVTLVESQNKKATFLKEVVRRLSLKNVKVVAARGEVLREKNVKANLVTMRAVERFAASAALAATLLQPDGRLALLIGAAQSEEAVRHLPGLAWQNPIEMPGGTVRVLLVGRARLE
ncbi:MAG TPA: 16S rRNA (guanine(527)-N(7))-methyltransferase RsmG [Terriglobales bacterium]|nr:16S rRNA (guanine(527)-N(7))-methyltransferase RsmG [Terriglobales bacterium]